MEQHVTHSLVQTLRTIPDFSPLDEHSLLEIVGESMNLFWKAGGTIFETGRAGEAFYVVLEGSVSIRDAEGNEVGTFDSGDSFGEISLLLNTTHRRQAVAVTDCEILVLPKEAFSRLLASSPGLAEHFDRVLKERVPETAEGERGG